MIMTLIVLGRNAVFKQTGDIPFIVCEGEMVKFAFKADCDLEEKSINFILHNTHIPLFPFHGFLLHLTGQTLISRSPPTHLWQSRGDTMGKQIWSFDTVFPFSPILDVLIPVLDVHKNKYLDHNIAKYIGLKVSSAALNINIVIFIQVWVVIANK